jgi:hypothetical protein
MFESDQACERARVALVDAGFGSENLRVYTSHQILEDHEVFSGALNSSTGCWDTHRRSGDDRATTLGMPVKVEEPCGVHVPEQHDATRAMRCLMDHQVLQYRYYGRDRQDDIHVR